MAAGNKPAGGEPVDAVALEPIKAGGKRVMPGEPLRLDAGTFEQLAAMGHVEAADAAQVRAEVADKAQAEAQAVAQFETDGATTGGKGRGKGRAKATGGAPEDEAP